MEYLSEILRPDQTAATHNAENVAVRVRDFVDDAIGVDHELPQIGKGWEGCGQGLFGEGWSQQGKVSESRGGVFDPEEPLCGRGGVALLLDCVVDFVQLGERGRGPDDGHSPCRSRKRFMASACSTPSPRASSSREHWTVRDRTKRSQRGSKSSALMRTVEARPFCVTMSGRCVSRTCEKQLARLLRHSVNGIMSSVRCGRQESTVFDCMRDVLHKFDDIVRYSVHCVKGAYGDAEYKTAVTSESLAEPSAGECA